METSDPLLNPEMQATFSEEEDTEPKMRHSSVITYRELLVYRLHNPKGQAVKDFLLIWFRKGAVPQGEHFNALREQCTSLLQEAALLESPLG